MRPTPSQKVVAMIDMEQLEKVTNRIIPSKTNHRQVKKMIESKKMSDDQIMVSN